MDYKQKYKEALEKLQEALASTEDGCKISGLTRDCIENIFPELAESEDEKIRKAILELVRQSSEILDKQTQDNMVNWLEKQGEQSVEPNWCHHEVDLSNCSEEYRKAYYDGWNNCNMQHSQCEAESNDIVKCLIDGMRFYYDDNKEATWGTDKFSMKVKDILAWLEKQCEQYPTDKVEPKPYGQREECLPCQFNYAGECKGFCSIKRNEQNTTDIVEPKFKVGDWLQYRNAKPFFVEEITKQGYVNGDSCLPFNWENEIHLWTINDAKDGDVLVDSLSGNNQITIVFKCIELDTSIRAHCGWNGYNFRVTTDGTGYGTLSSTRYIPATKEQRDLLFKKMKEAGYEWDAKNKTLWQTR